MPDTLPPELPEADIKAGFANELMVVDIDRILTMKQITPQFRGHSKYKQIMASIVEVGIIEPPAVYPDPNLDGRFLLLDGHLRIDILKALGKTTVTCLVSLDDEAFTFNKHISRIAPVQENRMIIRAIERGVSIKRLAAALNMDVYHIGEKRDLLKGICVEAVDLLKDIVVSPKLFKILKQMVPVRQIETVQLMIDADVFTESYALALLAGTPRHLLSKPEVPKKVRKLDPETMARMEREMTALQGDFHLIEGTYAQDVMHFTFAKGYLTSLMNNARVVRYLAANQPDILAQFQQITEVTSLTPSSSGIS